VGVAYCPFSWNTWFSVDPDDLLNLVVEDGFRLYALKRESRFITVVNN